MEWNWSNHGFPMKSQFFRHEITCSFPMKPTCLPIKSPLFPHETNIFTNKITFFSPWTQHFFPAFFSADLRTKVWGMPSMWPQGWPRPSSTGWPSLESTAGENPMGQGPNSLNERKKKGNFRGTSCQWDDKKGKTLGNQPDFPYEIEWIFL